MNTKICIKCKDDKNIDEFNFKSVEKNIRQNTCKTCHAEMKKKSYEGNKQATLDRNNRNKKKNKEWYDEYKSTLQCSKCDESHPACLDFHHINGEDKKIEIAAFSGQTYSKQYMLNEIKKCIVLCANCHRKHHYNEKHGLVG